MLVGLNLTVERTTTSSSFTTEQRFRSVVALAPPWKLHNTGIDAPWLFRTRALQDSVVALECSLGPGFFVP